MSEDQDMPCGHCDVGIYDFACAYSAAADAIVAGGPLPACKTFDRICVGAIHIKLYRDAEKEST